MPLTELQRHYWSDRYALKGKDGKNVETDIEETWLRVATAIADTDQETESFMSILRDFKFVPGGRILAGAGAESDKTFYNCYVIPVETKTKRLKREVDGERLVVHPYERIHLREAELLDNGNDSREAIFDTINTMVGIMSRGGGVGINWSTLRPQDSYLTRVSGSSSDPVGWMDVASKAVGEVIQGGSRRGAAMFMLDVWHPDVLKFIDAKRDNTRITNANVSVGVSDAFMEALSRDEDWTFIFPDTTHPEYDSSWDGDILSWQERGLPVVEHGTVSASSVWKAIAEAAHASGEPGVIFLDRYNELSTANGKERIICVNPCGEQGLGAYSVCNLGAMNLYAYVYDGVFGFTAFAHDVQTAIRFLDNVIDKTPDYLPETSDRQKQLRRIGLGAMGLADTLVALGLRYGSPEAVEFTEKVFRTMKDSAIRGSIGLALEKGTAEGWEDSMWDRPYLKSWREGAGKVGPIGPNYGLRNLFLLTQAPTGTTSLLADVNSGIEPYFNLKTWREDRTGGRWVYARAVEDVRYDDVSVPDYLVTAAQVTVEEHIAMQAAVQKYVDSSVSKTINAPKGQTVEETAKAFTLAYQNGLKGIAYYRDGSRNHQVLNNYNPNEKIAELEAKVAELEAKLKFKERVAWPKVETNSTTYRPMDLVVMAGASGDCPSCGIGEVVHEEGCQKCHSCGWSAC